MSPAALAFADISLRLDAYNAARPYRVPRRESADAVLLRAAAIIERECPVNYATSATIRNLRMIAPTMEARG